MGDAMAVALKAAALTFRPEQFGFVTIFGMCSRLSVRKTTLESVVRLSVWSSGRCKRQCITISNGSEKVHVTDSRSSG